MPCSSIEAVSHLQTAAHSRSVGQCGEFTRQGIEAGDVTLTRQISVQDYGSNLVAMGFSPLRQLQANCQAGDVVVIQGFDGHPHGHMAMYDGSKWISDFSQSGLYPGGAYRKLQPGFSVYRR